MVLIEFIDRIEDRVRLYGNKYGDVITLEYLHEVQKLRRENRLLREALNAKKNRVANT